MGNTTSCFPGAATSSECPPAVVGLQRRVTEVAPGHVNQHPYDSVVQVVVTRQTADGPHKVSGSGFLLKGVGLIEHDAIMTAAHAVSIGPDWTTEHPIVSIEMLYKGILFVIDDPLEGVDFLVHPNLGRDEHGMWKQAYDIGCIRFNEPSLHGYLSALVGHHGVELQHGGVEASQVVRILGHDNRVTLRNGVLHQSGPLLYNMDVLLPRMMGETLVQASPHVDGASGGPWLGDGNKVLAVNSGNVHYRASTGQKIPIVSLGAQLTLELISDLAVSARWSTRG
jgi:hypothetical protein